MARYWVGGSGTWDASTTTNWSDSDGGAGGFSAPTATDDVYFTTNSSTAHAAYTVTLSGSPQCLSLSMDGPDAGDATKVTWAGSATLWVWGNLDLNGGTAGITMSYTGWLLMKATTGTKTIKTYGIYMRKLELAGSGGNFQLLDNLIVWYVGQGSYFYLDTGATFDANGKNVTVYATSNASVRGAFTFYNLTITYEVGSTDYFFDITENITITGTFTIAGRTITNRFLVYSLTDIGTVKTITAAAVSMSYVDFLYITGAGAATWSGTSIGNAGGNSGISFTTPTTCTWRGTSGGGWSTAAMWDTGVVPLVHDTVIFDASSITSSGKTITLNINLIPALNFSSIANSPTLAISDNIIIKGSFNLTGIGAFTPSTTWSLSFIGTGTHTIKSNGLSIQTAGGVGLNLKFYPMAGSYSLSDNIVAGNLYLFSGTFDFNDKNAQLVLVQGGSATTFTKTYYFGNGTITLTGFTADTYGIFFNTTADQILYAEGSTIKITQSTTWKVTILGGGKTFNNVWITGSGNYITLVTGSNTFTDFKVDTAPKTIQFNAGSTQHVTTFTVAGTAGNEVTITSNSTAVHYLIKDGGGTVSCDYLNIQHSIATPAAPTEAKTWYAGDHSTNHQDVATAGSGWIFDIPPFQSPQITKGLQYEIKTTPTAITKGLQYSILIITAMVWHFPRVPLRPRIFKPGTAR